MAYVSDTERQPDGRRSFGGAGGPRLALGLRPGAVTRALAAVVLFLLAANIGAQLSRHVLGHPTALGLVELFDFNSEENIPTFFSAVLLLVCAAGFALIGAGRRQMGAPRSIVWLVLAAALVFMAIDEAATVHERVGGKLAEVIDASGYLHFPWVIPYSVLAALVGLAGLRAVRSLPVRTAVPFVLGGFLYLSGALGVEMLGARHASMYGEDNLAYAAFFTLEELLEMAGVVVLIHASLACLSRAFEGIDVRLGSRARSLGPARRPPGRARPADIRSGR